MKIYARIQAFFNTLFRTPTPTLQQMDYDNYWQSRGHSGMRPRYEVFASLIEANSTVLDLGCGEGAFLRYLAQQRNVQGTGIDISEVAVSLARERGVNASVADITAPDFSLDTVYDYIVMSEVIEHLAEPEHVLRKIRGNFRQTLLLSVPNIGYYRHRLRLMFGRFPVQWAYHPAEHLRYWTIIDFKLWLKELGYKPSHIIASDGTRFRFLYRGWPNLFGNQIVYQVHRAP
jgi:methionine biosynthesis protein MetW